MVLLPTPVNLDVKLPAVYDDLLPIQKKLAREKYIRQQNGLCYYCKSSLDAPPPKRIERKTLIASYPLEFFKHKIHLHHDHTTGLTLGATHARCNAILFEYHGE